MAWGEPANPEAAADLDDDRHYVGPPSIRTTGEIPAVTGELPARPVQPEVPTFHEPPSPPEPAEPEGPISARTPGGTVVTFPPTAAPGWVSGILRPDRGPEPSPPTPPMPGGHPAPAPGPARPPSTARGAPEVETHLSAVVGARRSTARRPGGSASDGASATSGLADVSPDVFASRTSVFPAVRTRRDRSRRRLRLGLTVALVVAVVGLVAIGSILGLGLR
jgi:hypothetical protein